MGAGIFLKILGAPSLYERDADFCLADSQRQWLAPVIQRTASQWPYTVNAGGKSKDLDLYITSEIPELAPLVPTLEPEVLSLCANSGPESPECPLLCSG